MSKQFCEILYWPDSDTIELKMAGNFMRVLLTAEQARAFAWQLTEAAASAEKKPAAFIATGLEAGMKDQS